MDNPSLLIDGLDLLWSHSIIRLIALFGALYIAWGIIRLFIDERPTE